MQIHQDLATDRYFYPNGEEIPAEEVAYLVEQGAQVVQLGATSPATPRQPGEGQVAPTRPAPTPVAEGGAPPPRGGSREATGNPNAPTEAQMGAGVDHPKAAASVQHPAQPAASPTREPVRTYDAKGHASDGSQSVGDDDPWKIGASAGMTYDIDTMNRWRQKAQSGDAQAQWVLRQVGYDPAKYTGDAALDNWARDRNVTQKRKDPGQLPWYDVDEGTSPIRRRV